MCSTQKSCYLGYLDEQSDNHHTSGMGICLSCSSSISSTRKDADHRHITKPSSATCSSNSINWLVMPWN